MDLLGDLGAADQLTSTRSENKVLKEKVYQLEGRVKFLAVENEALKVEVEMYRKEFAFDKKKDGGSAETTSTATNMDNDKDHFVQSGNSVYTKNNEVTLEKLHGMANPSSCALSNDDTILATGGAGQQLSLVQWGAALGEGDNKSVVDKAVQVACGAPVIAVDFSRKPRSPFVAAGCMDGTVHVVHYDTHSGLDCTEIAAGTIRHKKYVRTVAWSSKDNILASASADGCVQIHKIVWNGLDEPKNIKLEQVRSLILAGPVETLCIHQDMLVCYARGTPYLSYFDLSKEDLEQTKYNLNQGPGNAAFDEHVSFSVMDIQAHGNYLALATDTSRNIIIEFATGKLVRNLYGHKNDGFSQPKVAWSANGQYLYGNTQDDATLCVWDIASANIVQRLEGHGNSIRDMYSSKDTDTLVTTSFDKKTFIWLAPLE